MTRRLADTRQRILERAERLAVRLHVDAMENGNQAKAAGELPDEKVWWVVRQAAAEAVDALKRARGAPGTDPAKAASPPPPPEPKRDWMGVPTPNEKD